MQLQYPAEIDAHLSFAALDNAEVTVTCEGKSIDGRIGFADSFGTIPFFTQGSDPLADETEVCASYRMGNQLLEFVTRVVRGVGNRWQLRRPHNISVTYTDSSDLPH
ncbi:MAG: hypothetical protein ACI8S6_000769 [Myxococcota bacterium]|jgi:hypothetical protein